MLGGNLERTFKAGEMLEGAEVTKSVVQFNYMDGDNFVFMDMVSFETMEVPGATVGDDKIWMKEVRSQPPAQQRSTGLASGQLCREEYIDISSSEYGLVYISSSRVGVSRETGPVP